MTKSGRHVMEILEAFDLTHCAYAAAKLTGVDPKTVARYVAVRDAGGNPFEPVPRARIIDPYLEKIEELVERSHGKVRADVVHDNHLCPYGLRLVTSARRAVRSPRPRRPMTSVTAAPTDRGCPNQGCGHSTTGQGSRSVRTADVSVLCLGGLEPVPGGGSHLGPHPSHHIGVRRRHVAPFRGGTDLPTHRQTSGSSRAIGWPASPCAIPSWWLPPATTGS